MFTGAPQNPTTTHICVYPNGTYFDRDTVSHAVDSGWSIKHDYATIRLKPGQDPVDAAYAHVRAEQRYFASL